MIEEYAVSEEIDDSILLLPPEVEELTDEEITKVENLKLWI